MSLSELDNLICPACGATTAQGLNVAAGRCNQCHTEFFELNGLPCWFPSGGMQKQLWDDLLAKYMDKSVVTQEAMKAEQAKVAITANTRERLAVMAELRRANHQEIIQLLNLAGLTPHKQTRFKSYEPIGFSQYFELMLRDWAWQPLADSSGDYRAYRDENAIALASVLKVLQPIAGQPLSRVLVLGSGAGRLSWDLHCHLKPQQSVALDHNPLLAYTSKHLIKDQQQMVFQETRQFPHSGLPALQPWTLSCPPASQERRDSWFVFAGDAWAMPFADQSFDLVVTPWFIDIAGRDCKDALAAVERVLKPGGHWLNHGPLLYPDGLPESQRYTFEELRGLMGLARFDMLAEGFEAVPYTHSPLNERGRTEDLWSFLARSAPDRSHLQDAGESTQQLLKSEPPIWLLLPHWPIPRLTQQDLPEWMDNIVALIDGKRSLNDLARVLAPNIPEGHDPRQFCYDLFEQYVLQ